MPEPTVGGLTGKQLSLLDEIRERNEDESRCAFIFFPADYRGPEERCIEEPLDGSRFCEDHIPEPDWFDQHRDREFE